MTDENFQGTQQGFHLTAIDARRYDFGNALRGYDRSRVDQFRDQVAEELERLARSNQELEQKARSFHEQLKSFRERDKALNEALVSAQQLRGEIREQAEREAQLIVREAQQEADRHLASVRDEIARAQQELQGLWRTRRAYLAQLRNQLVQTNLSLRDLQTLLVRWDSLSVVTRRAPAIKDMFVLATEDALVSIVDAHTTAASTTQTSVSKELAVDEAEEDVAG
jgi:DivIVA domain-containing protein